MRVRTALLLGGMGLTASCSGGGCTSGCNGLEPLPGGFNPDERIENAASVRITSSGLTFLEENVGTVAAQAVGMGQGVLSFDVPPIDQTFAGFINVKVCENGANPNSTPKVCVAEVDLAGLNLNFNSGTPHNLVVTGDVPIRLEQMDVDTSLGDTIISLNGTGDCPGGGFADIGVNASVSIETDDDPTHARFGYSRIRLTDFGVVNSDLENAIEFCDGGLLSTLANFGPIKSFLVNQLVGPIEDTLLTAVEEQLCEVANYDINPPCPTGTNDVDGICRYGTTGDSECASIVLGLDGNAQLGSLLSSISPGTKGSMNFLFAAGGDGPNPANAPHAFGDLNPVGGGATLGMYGGIEPDPVSGCVAFSDMPRPEGIPIPDEILANDIAGWPANVEGPHLGLAVSERFLNYAFNGMYNSGLLCIGVTSDAVGPLLSSGTFGLLAASLKDLALQRENAPIALTIRPGAPPSVVLGNGTDINTDPLLRISLPQASFDFYIWSTDRYIRFMTATYDLDVPLNLINVPGEGLQPVIETIGLNNGSVTNSQLLKEDPALLASSLGELVAGQVGSALGGAISPIDISGSLSSLGLSLNVPVINRLQSGSDNFLGIFAAFEAAPPGMASYYTADTSVEIVDKRVSVEGLRAETRTEQNRPRVVALAKSTAEDDGMHGVEYQYRLDNGPWRPFTTNRYLDIDDSWLAIEGRHQLEVRSRIAGAWRTLDMDPATTEILIDTIEPTIVVSEMDEDDTVAINVDDHVSTDGRSMVRYRIGNATDETWSQWSEWTQASDLHRVHVGNEFDIEVEATDEEGNLAVAQQALIRGKPISGDSGCGCTVVGGDETVGNKTSWGLVGLGLLGMAFGLRRRRAGNQKDRALPATRQADVPRKMSRAARTRTAELFGGVALIIFAGSWSGCSCDDDGKIPSGGTYSCNEPECIPLNPGLIGSYTSVVANGSDIWVAGYLEADWTNVFSYGDLVVGRYNGTDVDWEIVDGVPTDPEPDGASYDLNGFRGGQTEPGDDVGLWTSIAIDGSGNPAVAYYDRTNKALKYAKSDGENWTVSTVDGGAGGDVGRYAKLQFIGGQPVIAYLAINTSAGGPLRSAVRVATGTSGGTFSIEDAIIDDNTPCRAQFCTTGVCVVSNGACTTEAAGCAECAAGDVCVDIGNGPTCEAIYGSDYLTTYHDAVGLYISTAIDAQGGLALAYYDRIHGNVEVASRASGQWQRVVVDGQLPDGTKTSDVGIGLDLHVDGNNDWHLVYVDGYDESIRYARVSGGTTPALVEVIDDGLSLGGTPHTDGQHIVGDDASIWVAPGGNIHVTYQDATTGDLRYAVGTPGASGNSWTVQLVDIPDTFGGFFSQVLNVDGGIRIAQWWRRVNPVEGNVAITSP